MEKKKLITICILVLAIVSVIVVGGIKLFNDTQNKKEEEKLISELKELFEGTDKVKADKSLIDIQKEIDDEINSYLKDTDITIDNAKVMVNPYKISPLTALIIFNTSSKQSVEIQINDGDKTSFTATQKHAIPIYGLIADKQNKVTVTTEDKKTKTFTIKTEALPALIMKMNIKTADKTKLNDDLYFTTSPMGEGSIAYDKDGNVRWYLTENFYINPLILDNGHIILSNGKSRDQFNSNTGFVEVDLLGKIYNEYILEEGYHHDVVVKDDNYIVAAGNPNRERYLDYIVEINSRGQVVKKWDLYEIVKKVDSEFVKDFSIAWAWNNSVFYDKTTNSLILSLRGRNSVVSIDYSTSKINWIFGDNAYWSDKFNSYLLTAGENTRLPYGQHSAFITKEGYLGFYNNYYESSDYTKSRLCSEIKDNYSSVGLYKLENKTITQVMNYDANQSLFSYALSNFKVLDNNNRLMMNGWEFTPQAYTFDNCTTFSNMDIYARIIELDENNNVLFDASINQGKYRVDKLSLYTEKTKEFSIQSFKKHGISSADGLVEVDLKTSIDKIKNAEETAFSYTTDTHKLTISGIYPAEDEIKLLFVGASGKGYESVIKNKDSNVVNVAYTDILSGEYKIYLIWNGEYKDTGIVLEY